jgi:chitinase
MEPYVDHLGFMAYDLHGSWDSENALGSLMRPHTDIRDIDNGLTPLWFDGVDPKKVVMGIAYYGRSFTIKDTDCPVMGCEYVYPGIKSPPSLVDKIPEQHPKHTPTYFPII